MFDVLSPDGFAIHHSNVYSNEAAAERALNEWIKLFERQGYYSSNKGRISLSDLKNHCTIIRVPNQ